MKSSRFTILTLVSLAAAACAGSPVSESAGGEASAMPNGAQVWADNCSRCHNLRPPDSYSDDDWQVVLHHMRVRANLTAKEHRAVLRFLQEGF